MQYLDAELVEAACAGDIDSFRQLYERYKRMAVGITRSRLFDTSKGYDLERYNEAATKEKADRTEIEQKMIDIQNKHTNNRNGVVLASFANEYTVGGRFRYLGKGVRLGSADRIVLFYKLKSTGTYRAVYGDLTVQDVTPANLPLPTDD